MLRWIVVVLATGCGRIDFATVRADAAGDTAIAHDGFDPDGPQACAGGDNICVPACLATDPDCATTCGDSRCVGNAGETCVNCASDCATQSPVCGNAACDPGEDSTTCYADCGPSPWPWVSDEASLVTMLNMTRTAGTTCPGGPAPAVGAVATSASLLPPAREWAWELAYQGYTGPGRCNGRSTNDFLISLGAGAAWIAKATDLSSGFNFWVGDGNACPSIMNGAWTEVAAAVAYGSPYNTYLIILK